MDVHMEVKLESCYNKLWIVSSSERSSKGARKVSKKRKIIRTLILKMIAQSPQLVGTHCTIFKDNTIPIIIQVNGVTATAVFTRKS